MFSPFDFVSEILLISYCWSCNSCVLYDLTVQHPAYISSASKMTYIVSGGALNSTHSLC